MPELRSCYFCGAVGDSLREYDLAPDDRLSAERSHSAVLCSTCHEKLRRVLEPLTEEASGGGPDGPVREPSSTPSITFDDDGTPSDGSDGTAETEEVEPETVTATDGTDSPEAADDDGDRATAADAGAEADDTGGDATEDAGDDAETEAGADTDPDPDVPESYYKVLRLLQNREFPMERGELTTLVTAAYDVSEPECERILETAVDRGVLVENGTTLDLGRN
ncbi:hypothetical protein [Haloplanus sp.]|uniref:hypothetical protein n=1 Tax=Haloplanus sp. TaxID=1961696 RepID=UPI002630E8AB|nr:hypothetical protein [Haloplanus sp.]